MHNVMRLGYGWDARTGGIGNGIEGRVLPALDTGRVRDVIKLQLHRHHKWLPTIRD